MLTAERYLPMTIGYLFDYLSIFPAFFQTYTIEPLCSVHPQGFERKGARYTLSSETADIQMHGLPLLTIDKLNQQLQNHRNGCMNYDSGEPINQQNVSK